MRTVEEILENILLINKQSHEGLGINGGGDFGGFGQGN
jgi:hypothetical protein